MSRCSPSSATQSLPAAGSAAGQGKARRGSLIALSAFVVMALTLRSPLTAVAPIVDELRQGLDIGSVTAGLLTSIPVLCFGVLTPVASLVIARSSIERAIFVTLAGAALGLIVRSAGGIESALAGTVILGACLTVGNIVSLMVIARDFPGRPRLITGVYTAALNVGTMLTSAVTAPVAALFGWRIALASSICMVIPAALLWFIAAGRRHRTDERAGGMPPGSAATARPAPGTGTAPLPPVWRRGVVLLLAFAFGAHLFVYYSITAWLPAYLRETIDMNGTEAGLVASLFQILALVGSFGVPALASVVALPRLMVAMAVCWIVTPLGLLLAPHGWPVWSVVGGVATGGAFTVVFMLIMALARDLQDNRKISSFVQGVGYSFSAIGPLVVGSLHQLSGGWSMGFILLGGVAVGMTISGLGIERLKTDRTA